MSEHGTVARRSVATLAAALLGVACAGGIAHAGTVGSGYDTSNGTGTIGPAAPGDAISRAQIISRADDWINAQVPYSQTEGWEDSATGGPYRMDCSGFVSMAWGLPTSMVTSTLPEVATVTDGNISGDSNLNAGDALDYTADHVVLFDHWTDGSGDFAYDAEHTYGQVTNESTDNIYDSTLEGYAMSDFEALSYNKLTASTVGTPVAAVPVGTGGSLDFFYLNNGTVEYRTTASNGSWLGIAEVPNAPSGVTSLTAVPLGNGSFDLFYVTGGKVVYQTGNGSGGWLGTATPPNAPTGVTNLAAVPVGTGGNFDLFYNVGGSVKYVTGSSSGTFLGTVAMPNAPTGVTNLAAVPVGTGGNFDLFYNVGGSVKYVTGSGAGTFLGTIAMPNAPTGVTSLAAASVGTGGNFDLFYNVGGSVKYVTGSGAGTFLGTIALPGAPSGVSSIAAGTLGSAGQFNLFFDENNTIQYMTGNGDGTFLGLADLTTS
jgi:ribosomal protein L27